MAPLKRLREFKADGLERLQHVSLEITQKEKKKKDLTDSISDNSKNLNQMYELGKQLDLDLETNESAYQSIDAQLKENDDIISEIQDKREETLQKIRLLETEQSQRQVRCENIVTRLEERYGRNPVELKREFFHETEIGESYAETPREEIEEKLAALRKRLDRIGDVNIGAIKEYDELKVRYDFLTEQHDDLVKAIEDLHKVIRKINRITQERFTKTFHEINEKLGEVFPRLFEGGTAKLVLTDPNDPLETGVEFLIHPPGKKLTRMSLLSGGEKALSAIAFLFAIFLIKPASFCLMDEIDAPLDDVNIYRFNELLKIIGEKSQIIMVTHNKKSMEFADTLFGITMEQKGVSKIVSVNLQ